MKSKILVIDDDSIILFIHKTMIKNSGIEAEVAYFLSAELALSYIMEFKQNHDFLLLLDINMPVMNGWELLDILKDCEFKDQIHVVMVTSSINEADRSKARSYEQVYDYLTKPIKVADFVNLQSHKKVGRFFRPFN
ncbi:MAG: response regulator [Chitinophagaceae bacterium]|nr:MAG: response regulator [Chitinophagaceae bacterium]